MKSSDTYFTRDEVVIHNTRNDFWVSVNRSVFDLSDFFRKRADSITDVSFHNFLLFRRIFIQNFQNLLLLLQFGGKDLSWAFNKHGEPLTRTNQNCQSVPLFPPVNEKSDENSDFWWKDSSYIIGKVTCLERHVRIINTLTRKIITLSICEEDSIEMIQEKFSQKFNRDARNYVWRKSSSLDKRSGRLFPGKTLTQNGILFGQNEQLGLPAAIWIFFFLNKSEN